MIWVFVDHDLVASPIPIADEADVLRRDAEIESAKPETAGSTAFQMKDVSGIESASKAPVFPRMVHMVVGIVAA